MRFRLFVSSLLPLLLLLICSVHVHGQDPFSDENPFGDTPKPQESQPPKAAKAPAESAKLKAFRAQLKSIEETFAQMSFREEALRGALESMELSMEKERLRKEDGTIDDHVKAMFERSKEIEKKLQRSTDINERLKSRVDQLEASEEELRRTSEKAVADHGEMHKSLFESLLFSDEPGHQELAFKHLVKCIESAHAKQISVSLHTPKVHGRIAKLTGSDSAQVRDIASKCLFRLKPDDAMELGIQFGPTWKPLEYSKTGNNTLRINHALEMPFDLIYDEATLEEIVEDLQMGLAIQIRLAPDVPEDQLVTVNSVGRTLFHSLSGMLADNYLGMATKRSSS